MAGRAIEVGGIDNSRKPAIETGAYAIWGGAIRYAGYTLIYKRSFAGFAA